MKRLGIIIPHERLQEVNDILHKNKVGGMTFYDIKGRGRSKREPVSVGREGIMRYVPEFASRIKIEVIVSDSLAKPIIDDIINVIRTGSDYDGKIFFMMLLKRMILEQKKLVISHYREETGNFLDITCHVIFN